MKFSEIINKDNKFDLMILAVFTAWSDLVSIAKLMDSNTCSTDIMLTLFKVHIGIIKEVGSLFTRLFDNYKTDLEEFSNFQMISELYEKFKKCYDKDMYDKYLKIRNYTFHYSKIDTDNDITATMDLSDFDTEFKICETYINTEFPFILEIYFKHYNCIMNGKQNNSDSTFSENIRVSSQIGTLELEIIGNILSGFMKKKGLI